MLASDEEGHKEITETLEQIASDEEGHKEITETLEQTVDGYNI